MRRYLYPENTKAFKANLHTHSTYSDGCLTPQELKELYKKNGYSILAFTDHDIFVPHNDLTDEDLLILNGYEIEVTEEQDDFDLAHCCHLCMIAKDKEMKVPACLHHEKYMFAGALTHKDEMAPFEGDFEREYSSECVNTIIKSCSDAGFFVTYNHPVWSLENYPIYSTYEGMDAVEMFNTCSFKGGMEDMNPQVYDDLLRLGRHIGCTGCDDCHDSVPEDDPLFDSCVSFTMIMAPELTYPAVAKALEKGHYYASMGPVIKALYEEDGIITAETSLARSIAFTTGTRHSAYTEAADGKYVDRLSFSPKASDGYFRITVCDDKGNKAYSGAFFLR